MDVDGNDTVYAISTQVNGKKAVVVEVDPYFNGEGPLRSGCQECAGCMVGCRYNAKNTLDKNYLYFAEKSGAQILDKTLATRIEHKDGKYIKHKKNS